MNRISIFCVILALLASLPLKAAEDRYLKVKYDASSEPDQLQMGVTYTLWIPQGVDKLRGIIVHQHGCGTGACTGGQTAAFDLHWQALARKWDCALLGPSYQQGKDQSCWLWSDPRNGSRATFLRAIDQFAEDSEHAELKSVPWCLWGHSGGGSWCSLMQTLDPERIVAGWYRSGSAFPHWEAGTIPKPEISAAVYEVPVMCSPGEKENDEKQFYGAWGGGLHMFKTYRAHGAPIGFAPDPRTGHECGDSRYLAIPFLDACLKLRLPDSESQTQKLKLIDQKHSWLAEPLSHHAVPAADYTGDPLKAVWLPDETVARDWEEYVQTGAVSDPTPPPAPRNVRLISTESTSKDTDKSARVLTWEADADFESGIQQFLILRNGNVIGKVPEQPIGRFGRPLFQSMSYHDTPEAPLPEMTFLIPGSDASQDAEEYQVITINSVGLKSSPSRVE